MPRSRFDIYAMPQFARMLMARFCNISPMMMRAAKMPPPCRFAAPQRRRAPSASRLRCRRVYAERAMSAEQPVMLYIRYHDIADTPKMFVIDCTRAEVPSRRYDMPLMLPPRSDASEGRLSCHSAALRCRRGRSRRCSDAAACGSCRSVACHSRQPARAAARRHEAAHEGATPA